MREDLNITNKDRQSLFVQLKNSQGNDNLIGVIYRHPKKTFEEFTKKYENLLIDLASKKIHVYHC